MRLLLTLLVMLLGPLEAMRAQTLTIPKGRSIVVNGTADSLEWSDAVETRIVVEADWNVRVRLKHDGENLLVAFFDLRSGVTRVPEVLIDAKFDKGNNWKSDDWWFHASAQDCASSGRFNDYTTCVPEAREWSANNVRGMTFPQVIEIRIPMRYAGIAPGGRIGLALNVTDTNAIWNFWPAGAQLAAPGSWADVQLSK